LKRGIFIISGISLKAVCTKEKVFHFDFDKIIGNPGWIFPLIYQKKNGKYGNLPNLQHPGKSTKVSIYKYKKSIP